MRANDVVWPVVNGRFVDYPQLRNYCSAAMKTKTRKKEGEKLTT
jgi:hypothetical protein